MIDFIKQFTKKKEMLFEKTKKKLRPAVYEW